MARVLFTPHLRRYFPAIEDGEFEGETVAALLGSVEARHAGLSFYVTDERGALRKHVSIYVGANRLRDRERLSDPVPPGVEVRIWQALSGG